MGLTAWLRANEKSTLFNFPEDLIIST